MTASPSEVLASAARGRTPRAARRRPKRPDGTGSIKLRGRIFWIGYKHNGKQVWESTKQDNEKVAEQKLRETLRSADTPAHITAQAQRVSFDDVAAVLLAEAKKKRLRSLPDIKRKVEQLREAFGGPWLAITTARVNTYQAECAARGEALGTTNRRLAELRHMGRLAMRQTPRHLSAIRLATRRVRQRARGLRRAGQLQSAPLAPSTRRRGRRRVRLPFGVAERDGLHGDVGPSDRPRILERR